MIHCEYENKPVPEREFIHLKNGIIFQPYIHDVTPLHFADGTLLVLPSQSSLSRQQSSPNSPPPGTPSRPGEAPFTIKEIKDGDPSGGNIVALLRMELSRQLNLIAQDMPIEKLQALVKYAEDLSDRGNE